MTPFIGVSCLKNRSPNHSTGSSLHKRSVESEGVCHPKHKKLNFTVPPCSTGQWSILPTRLFRPQLVTVSSNGPGSKHRPWPSVASRHWYDRITAKWYVAKRERLKRREVMRCESFLRIFFSLIHRSTIECNLCRTMAASQKPNH